MPPLTRTSSNPQNASIHVGPVDATSMEYPSTSFASHHWQGPSRKSSTPFQRTAAINALSPSGSSCPALPFPSSSPTSSLPPITSTTSIIDLGGVSLGLMWSLRRHLQQASELATAHYPETLHTIAVINAPTFFPTVWSWIKAWFDEGTRNKVHVLGADPGPALLELMDADSLPQVYGGALPFSFEDEPILDGPARNLLGSTKIPRGPIVFVDGKVVQPDDVTISPNSQSGAIDASYI